MLLSITGVNASLIC